MSAAELPENEQYDLLLSEEFLRNCVDMFSVPSKGVETNSRTFPLKHLNIIDPLKENNNLGRSVNKGIYLFLFQLNDHETILEEKCLTLQKYGGLIFLNEGSVYNDFLPIRCILIKMVKGCKMSWCFVGGWDSV